MIFFNLRVLMAERGLTISKIHRDTGINRVTLTAINNNTNQSVSLNIVNTLCNYLNVNLTDLLLYVPFDYEIKVNKITDTDFKFLIKYWYKNKVSDLTIIYNVNKENPEKYKDFILKDKLSKINFVYRRNSPNGEILFSFKRNFENQEEEKIFLEILQKLPFTIQHKFFKEINQKIETYLYY